MRQRETIAVALTLLLLTCARVTHAYRPFDSTDAAVADPGELELELGPTQFYRQGSRPYLIAPSTVLNFGFARDLELVTDLKAFVALKPVDEPRWRVSDTDVLVKWVMRRGKLQGESGLSIATETGVLVPEIHGDDGFGAQMDLISSYGFGVATLHLNEQIALTRLRNIELFSGLVVEGPHELVVRPVAELFVERNFSEGWTRSALLGVIWPVRDWYAVDLAFRAARIEQESAYELRFGFTWAIPVWSEPRRRVRPANAQLPLSSR